MPFRFNPEDIDAKFVRQLRRAFTDRVVLDNKIIDRTNQPTIFNILTGLRMLRDNNYDKKLKNNININLNRVDLAEEMLMLTNIATTDHKKHFSLLESESNKEEENNPNIIDQKDFENTYNQLIQTDKHFVDDKDTFYQLDDDVELSMRYRYIRTDPSVIASRIHEINVSREYKFANKYYKPVEKEVAPNAPEIGDYGPIIEKREESVFERINAFNFERIQPDHERIS